MSFINLIRDKYGIQESFVFTETPGLANSIYMSDSYVMRIPSDHPESIPDAFTESVAVPNVLRYGIKTRRLIVFDDSYTIINKPYSIWEKVNGIPITEESAVLFPNTWFELGKELRRLHTTVIDCFDPNNYLDTPDRDYSVDDLSMRIEDKKSNSFIAQIIKGLDNPDLFNYEKCFVHGDTNPGNILSSAEDSLLSLIDWGDSGWGDPAIDFYMIPPMVIKYVIKGYLDQIQYPLSGNFYKRVVLDKIAYLMDEDYSISAIEDIVSRLLRDISEIGNLPLTSDSSG